MELASSHSADHTSLHQASAHTTDHDHEAFEDQVASLDHSLELQKSSVERAVNAVIAEQQREIAALSAESRLIESSLRAQLEAERETRIHEVAEARTRQDHLLRQVGELKLLIREQARTSVQTSLARLIAR